MRNIHHSDDEASENREKRFLASLPPASPDASFSFSDLSERLFGIKVSEENPFQEAYRRNSEQAAKMERMEAEVKSLRNQVGKAYQAGIDDTLAELEIGDRARDYEALRQE